MFCSDPVSRLSTQITRWPCPSRCSQRWEPRKPAPPVTTQVLIAGRCYRGASRLGVLDDLLQFPAFSWPESVHSGGENRHSRVWTWVVQARSRPVHRGACSGRWVSDGAGVGHGSRRRESTSRARKRAAVETDRPARAAAAAHRAPLLALRRRTPRTRYQRALEILLTKAPTGGRANCPLDADGDQARGAGGPPQPRADARRRPAVGRGPRPRGLGRADPGRAATARTSRSSAARQIARSREALQTLKPAELRALTLLAEGYSYAEIGEITGFTQTKVNRCLAEGRERFRTLLSRSEDGSRCAELRPLLSAFCDGEAERRGCRRRARAPAGLRQLPGDDARLPGGARRRRRAGAGPARAAPCSSAIQDLGAAVQSRLPFGGGGGDSASRRSPPRAGPAAPGWPRWRSCWRSAPAPPAERPPASPPGSRPRPCSPHHEAKAPVIEHVSKTAVEAPAPEPVEPAPPTPEPEPEPAPSRHRRRKRSNARRPPNRRRHRLRRPEPRPERSNTRRHRLRRRPLRAADNPRRRAAAARPGSSGREARAARS